ncbi:hypothetical protein JCM30237_30320 [Halolamina litorea]|uniref:Uncharacterized protein n=1 Tax=Halolamina litorea TaxID=1515593 RepID=A0ABD6BRZ7_9EURY|nr:hypothetical protein [Halolamina litorea]
MWQIGDADADWRVRDTRLDCDLHAVVHTVAGPHAVGGSGTLAADRGKGWQPLFDDGPATEGRQLRAIDVTDDGGRLWIAGADGSMACYDVRAGRRYDYGYPAELADSWGGVAVAGPRGREKVLAADRDGRVLPFVVDGTTPEWGSPDRVAAGGGTVAALASTPEGVGFAVDTEGTAYKTSPETGWDDIGVVDADAAVGDLYAGPGEQVYVAASDGHLYRYGSSYHSWTPIEVGDAGLRAVDVYATDARERMTALGADGRTFERVAANRWEAVPARVDARLTDLALGPVDVIVSGNGIVVERDHTAAEKEPPAEPIPVTDRTTPRVGRE